MINIFEIKRGITETIDNLVGANACPDRQIMTSPSIVARMKGRVPPFPVAVVDSLPMGQYGISSVSDTYLDDNENLVREVRYKLSFIIDVHGAVEDNVMGIAQEIRDSFFRTYGMEELHANTGVGLLGVSAPSVSFVYLNTEYQETARIVLDMSATDTFIEDDAATCPATGVIESIIVDGELKENEEDSDPLDTRSTAP